MEKVIEKTIFLDTEQFAARWVWHVESARRFLRDGKIPSVIIGRRRLVRLDDVEQYENDATVGRK
jgi:hypothetical protein